MTTPTPTPRLSSLHVHPVKSLGGQRLSEAVVEPWGLAGDRRWMLTDTAGRCVTQREQPRLALARAESSPGGGLSLTAPGMPVLDIAVPGPSPTVPVQIWGDEVEAVPAGDAAAAWFGRFLGAEVALVHLDDPARRRPIDPGYARPGETVSLADGFPLLVTTEASLADLNALIAAGDHPAEGPLPMDRFRPNAVIAGTEPWAEDTWTRIRIGEVEFRVVKPCGRCVVTTTDQRTAVRGREPLRTLARHRRIGGRLVFGQNLVPVRPGTLRVGDALMAVR
ncbi:MOSC domain-containing protein [Streptomyces sp. ME01-24h]|nr:MOSC domain-containing protein [Streptomyces sp. ME19-03-3]MDX3352210.1 MOSC domain-containing protein [Streptomyces sp. ME01-24h]